MKIHKFSDQKLLSIHSIARKAIEADDALPEGRKKFAVRTLPGWKTLVAAVENELERRDIRFIAIGL